MAFDVCSDAVGKLQITPQRLGRLDSLDAHKGRRKIKLAVTFLV